MAHSCHAGLGPSNLAELAMIVLEDKMTKWYEAKPSNFS